MTYLASALICTLMFWALAGDDRRQALCLCARGAWRQDHPPRLIEALIFPLGLAAVLLLPAFTWVLVAGHRLNKFFKRLESHDSNLLLLFPVSITTVVFPMITSIASRADMQPIWTLQGLSCSPF